MNKSKFSCCTTLRFIFAVSIGKIGIVSYAILNVYPWFIRKVQDKDYSMPTKIPYFYAMQRMQIDVFG